MNLNEEGMGVQAGCRGCVDGTPEVLLRIPLPDFSQSSADAGVSLAMGY